MLRHGGMQLAILVTVLTVSSARADERSLAREHYSKGTKAFELGLYDEAITEYVAAYKAKDDPALLYNIAQAHRLAGHSAEALRFYRMYLIKLPGSDNRAEVENKIEELAKLVEQQKRATQQLPPDEVLKPVGRSRTTEAPTLKTEPSSQPAIQPIPLAAPPAVPPTDRPSGRTKKIAGLAVGAVGVAAVAAGLALELLAKQSSDELTALDRAGGVYDPAKQSAGQTKDVAGAALLGIGGAAVVAGVVVAALGFREAKAARAVALSPLVSPNEAGAVLRVTF